MLDKDKVLAGLVSVVLHGAVLALLLITLPLSPQTAQPEDVKVELVPPPQATPEQKSDENTKAAPDQKAFETASNDKKENIQTESTKPSEAENSDTTQPVEPESEPHQEKASASEPILSTEKASASAASLVKQETQMLQAKKIYSKDALSNPRVKQALGKLSPTDRVIQICGIEALEQIRHHRSDIVPDMMARNGGALTSSSLKMSGGAFRSRAKWYNLDFDCRVNPKDMAVSSFQYAIGDPIAKKDWSRRELPAD